MYNIELAPQVVRILQKINNKDKKLYFRLINAIESLRTAPYIIITC